MSPRYNGPFDQQQASQLVSSLLQITERTAASLGVGLPPRWSSPQESPNFGYVPRNDPYYGPNANQEHRHHLEEINNKHRLEIESMLKNFEKEKAALVDKTIADYKMKYSKSCRDTGVSSTSDKDVVVEVNNGDYTLIHTNSRLVANSDFEILKHNGYPHHIFNGEKGGIVASLDQLGPRCWVHNGCVISEDVKLFNNSMVEKKAFIDGKITLDNTVVSGVNLTGQGKLTNCVIRGEGEFVILSDMTGTSITLGKKSIIQDCSPYNISNDQEAEHGTIDLTND